MRRTLFAVLIVLSTLAIPLATAAPVTDVAGAAAAGDPLQIALDYIERQAPALGLTPADIADLIVTDQYTSALTGVTHIYLRQQYEGIEVVGANLNINILPDGSVLSMHHSFVPNLAAAIQRKHRNVDPLEAAEFAAADRGLGAPEDLRVIAASRSINQEVVLSDGGISQEPIPARLVYEVVGPDDVRLAWQLEIFETSGRHWWNLRVDAETGEVIGEDDYGDHLEPEYTVYEIPTESPNHGARTVVVDPAGRAPNASPYGWHDTDGVPGPEYTTTQGNNVHAYTDTDGDDLPDPDSSPDGGEQLHFNFPLDLTEPPSAYRDASVTNLFYWNNVIHDVLYQYGFDEVSGNFQFNNYGKGGLGGDYVLAQAHNPFGFNNAFFFTPPDGQHPRMYMLLWTTANPRRDSALDAGVILHEYGHGVSNRLTGGPSTASCLNNAEQMGEGWSDFLALVLTANPGDTATTSRGIATYVLNQPANGVGLRQWPYTTDMTVNPATYDTIKSALGAHDVGTVWATMLWEVYWALVTEHGFNPNLYNADLSYGNSLALRLVLDGMKLQPCSPGFVDGRDAILAADVALTGGENQCLIWTAFAKRGLGAGAFQGSSDSRDDGAEIFDVPLGCPGGADTTPPRASIAINGGAGLALDPNVTLTLSASDYNGISSYWIADSQAELGVGAPQTVDPPELEFAATVPYTLPGGVGTKEVWFRVCDVADNCVDVSTSILLDPSQKANFTPIVFPTNSGPATPYPSTITISDMVGAVTHLRVILWGVYHTWPSDIDILLVGPSGQSTILMSDAGGLTDIVGVILTFDDDAPASLPFESVIASGTYKPTNHVQLNPVDAFPAPAPPAPHGATLSEHYGYGANGDWHLFVVDDTSFDAGQILGGWSLQITTTGVDDLPPTDVSIEINAGAQWTNTPTVSLSLAAHDDPGIASYRLAESQAALDNATAVEVDPAELTFTRTVAYTLSPGDHAAREVWLRVCDAADNCLDASDTIGLDTTPPDVTVPDDITVVAPTAAGIVVDYPPASVAPDLSGASDPECLPPSGQVYLPGVHEVTCTSTDGAGNVGSATFTITVGRHMLQGCLFAGSLTQLSVLPYGTDPSGSCARGELIVLYQGLDYYGCVFAGSLTQVGTSEPVCGRGTPISLSAGADLHGCLYAGSLTQVGTSVPTNCGRGTPVAFERADLP